MNFSMAVDTEKQIEAVEAELKFLDKALEGDQVHPDVITEHELPKRFPTLTKRLKKRTRAWKKCWRTAKHNMMRIKATDKSERRISFSLS